MEQLLDFQANWVDLAIVVIIATGLTLGLTQGLLRQVLALGGLYVSAVLALQYSPVAARLASIMWPQTDPWSRATFGMALVFIVSFAIMNLLSYYLYQETRLSSVAILDHGGGAVAGMVSGWVMAAIAINLLNLSFRFVWGGWESIEAVTQSQFNQSVLVPILHSQMPMLYDMIRPWLPGGLPLPFLF